MNAEHILAEIRQLAVTVEHELWIGFVRDPDGNPVGLVEEMR